MIEEELNKDAFRPWTATITPEEMAFKMVADLCKKFEQLNAAPQELFETIAKGLVDGLRGTTFGHPQGDLIPDYRRSMDPSYCAGFEVGSTWRKIAQEWPERMADNGGVKSPAWDLRERHLSY